MKKIIFFLLLSIGVGNISQAQFLKNIKTKVKAAADNSVDRSTNKVIDKTINNPADNATDTVLDKTGRKVNSLFKKKKDKKAGDPEHATDSNTDSTATVVPILDSTATKPKDQN